MKIVLFDAVYIVAFLGLIASWYLLRPLRHHPQPAPFLCLNQADGKFKTMPLKPKHIYGIGLSYAKHIDETAHEFNPGDVPAVFVKSLQSLLPGGGSTGIPSAADMIAAASGVDPQLPTRLREKFGNFSPLMDYEVELGFILLENISDSDLADPAFMPKLGFFIANDVSSRALQILGEGMPNRLEYWGMSKSLPDFLPVTKKIWVPSRPTADAIPCVTLETRVNGEVRQLSKTNDMIYTPRQMLAAARQTWPKLSLAKGDMFITGTPGGIALATPRIKARLAQLLRFDRFTKLKFILKADQSRFLKAGDEVTVSGEWLGSVTTWME